MKKTNPGVFSRKALNIIIFLCMVLILVFSQFKGPNTSETDPETLDGLVDQPEASATQSTSESIAKLKNDVAIESSLKQAKDFFPELAYIPEIPKESVTLALERWQTQNGMRVVFKQSESIPMVDIRLVFRAGAAVEPEAKQGIAQLTASLNGMGGKHLNASQVALGFDALGANFTSASYQDMAVVSLRSLSESRYFDEGFKLFQDVVSDITFALEDFERQVSRRQIVLKQETVNPSVQLNKAAYKALFPDHPYGRPSQGTLESLDTIEASDVVAFYKAYYRAKNGVLAIIGDIDRQQAELLAEQLSQSFSSEPVKVESIQALGQVLGQPDFTASQHIEFPSEQTSLLLLARALPRGHKDYYSLYLANHILGGSGFASRLNKSIRQNRGLAYSVGSYLQPMTGVGVFGISLQTRGDQAEEALGLVHEVLKDMALNGPTDDDIAFAQQQILSEFVLRVANNSNQLGYLGSIGFYDLPLNYVERFQENIRKVTAKDVQDVVARYLNGKLTAHTIGQVKVSDEARLQMSDAQKISQTN